MHLVCLLACLVQREEEDAARLVSRRHRRVDRRRNPPPPPLFPSHSFVPSSSCAPFLSRSFSSLSYQACLLAVFPSPWVHRYTRSIATAATPGNPIQTSLVIRPWASALCDRCCPLLEESNLSPSSRGCPLLFPHLCFFRLLSGTRSGWIFLSTQAHATYQRCSPGTSQNHQVPSSPGARRQGPRRRPRALSASRLAFRSASLPVLTHPRRTARLQTLTCAHLASPARHRLAGTSKTRTPIKAPPPPWPRCGP